jgi:hypothetical protein
MLSSVLQQNEGKKERSNSESNSMDAILEETKSDHVSTETVNSNHSSTNLKEKQIVMDKLVVRKNKSAAMAIRWCLDRDAEVCFGCRDDFSLFVRKHHCRSCGGVFCASCSRFQKILPLLGYDTPTRVCGFCYHDESLESNLETHAKNKNYESRENNKNNKSGTLTTKRTNQRKPLGAVSVNTTDNIISSNSNNNSTKQQSYTKNNNLCNTSTVLTSRKSNFKCFSMAAPAWVEDHASDECQQCATEFAILVRRHHCRGCGGLFCWECTERKLALPHYGYISPVRVCISCSSPQILNVTNVPTIGGKCTIIGHNLGTIQDEIMIEVRGINDNTTVQCMDVRVVDEQGGNGGEMLTCLVPSGIGTNQPLRVTVNSLRGMSSYSYLPPLVDKTSVVNTTGGELIITGSNFGDNVEKVLVEWYDEEDGNYGDGIDEHVIMENDNVNINTNETKEEKRSINNESKNRKQTRGIWKTCTNVEMLVPHKVLRVVVGSGSGTHAKLHVNVAGVQCQATYNHALPFILETTPVSAGGGPIDIIGKHFGTKSSNVSVFIDGVQCTNVVIVAPHTKIRCIAPRVRPIGRKGILEGTRAPHLTPPPIVVSSKHRKNRERLNSGDERRDLVVQVSNLKTTSEMTYINEKQHNAFQSSRNIEVRQRNNRRLQRPASTPPREYATIASRQKNDRAPWLPDEHVLQCMLCQSRFGFFTRKHHCRNCGIVICASCSKHTQYVEAYGSMQRVCTKCHTSIATKSEEISMLKHQLDHIATMRSIEAGKKSRYERDLIFMRMQQPPANPDEIKTLELRISEQDRRVASKQNQFNKIQQKLLDLTVNSSGDNYQISSYAESSISSSSISERMPPSPTSSSMGHRTPPVRKNMRRGGGGGGDGGDGDGGDGGDGGEGGDDDGGGDNDGGGGGGGGGYDCEEKISVPIQQNVRPYSSMSNKSINSRASEQEDEFNDLSANNRMTFSNKPPANATRPIAVLSSKNCDRRNVRSISSDNVNSNGIETEHYLPPTTSQLLLRPERPQSTPPLQSRQSTSFGSPAYKINLDANDVTISNNTPSSEQSISPSQLLTSGLLRGRTLEEYSMCTFSASPERSWVGASRLDQQRKSIRKKNRRHSSPNMTSRKRLSTTSTGDNSSNNINTPAATSSLFIGSGLTNWVKRRLGRNGDSSSSSSSSSNSATKTDGETKSNSSSSSSTSKRAPGSSMLVAVHRGAKCVLKELSMGDEMTRQRIEREVAIRGMFQEPVHPNIAPLEAIFYEQELGKMYIHYRLVEVGNLADWLSAGKPQPWDIQSVFQQLAGTLVYLHSHQIVHRCLSLDNILIGIQGDAQGELPRPYVTDFGDSIVVPREVLSGMMRSRRRDGGGETKHSSSSNTSMYNNSSSSSSSQQSNITNNTTTTTTNQNSFVGDPEYRAPELNQGIQATSACDMWALGIMLYKATFGLYSEPVALGGASVPIPPHRNARLRALIKALLHVDPAQRLDAIGAMVHPYFTISHAAEMHSSGNVIRPAEKLDLFKKYLNTIDRSEAIQFIRVRRETVVRDVLREFSRFGRGNLEKRLIVMYEGESGVDAGGLTKDMFTRFFSQLFAEHIGMFVASEDGSSGTTGEVGLERGERTYLPSPSCELMSYMEALGKVIAKVVMDGHTIDAKFAPVLYKYLIRCLINGENGSNSDKSCSNNNNDIGFSDLESFDGQLFGQLHDNVLNQTITPEYADALALDFEDLVPNGEQRIVTDANKIEYLNLRAYHILIGQRKRQLDAIKRGFNILPWKNSFNRFNETDFRTLICGTSTINADSIISNIDFDHGDWKRSKTLEHVVKYLKYLEKKKNLRLFLRFVTGSPGLPAMGLHKTESQPAGKICFTRLPNSQRLPEAHTCFNTVDMPDYNNYETLKNKMDIAMNGDDGKFDLL